jgi:hypothetical protein
MSEQFIKGLKGPFNLSSDRERKTKYFRMDTKYIHFRMNGQRLGTESYLLKLQYIPKTSQAENLDQYMCSEFQLQINDNPPVTIPELRNWTYTFNPTLSGADGCGPLWGISQEKFRNIADSLNKVLPFSIRYAIYNNFIDFHSINDIFSRPIKSSIGIQDLKNIGQKIVHPASFIEAPITFGAEIKPNSIFQNGEITLEFKGVSVVDGTPCALIAYDSGECKLKMIMPVSLDQESVAESGSQYKGEIYIDLATQWVRKATLDEYMTIEISSRILPSKINEYIVRHILLCLIGQEDFKTG